MQNFPRARRKRAKTGPVRGLPVELRGRYGRDESRRKAIAIDGAEARRAGLGALDRGAIVIRTTVGAVRQQHGESLGEEERNEENRQQTTHGAIIPLAPCEGSCIWLGFSNPDRTACSYVSRITRCLILQNSFGSMIRSSTASFPAGWST